jgi:hypothetical protein
MVPTGRDAIETVCLQFLHRKLCYRSISGCDTVVNGPESKGSNGESERRFVEGRKRGIQLMDREFHADESA